MPWKQLSHGPSSVPLHNLVYVVCGNILFQEPRYSYETTLISCYDERQANKNRAKHKNHWKFDIEKYFSRCLTFKSNFPYCIIQRFSQIRWAQIRNNTISERIEHFLLTVLLCLRRVIECVVDEFRCVYFWSKDDKRQRH